jgi:hypothetical protein
MACAEAGGELRSNAQSNTSRKQQRCTWFMKIELDVPGSEFKQNCGQEPRLAMHVLSPESHEVGERFL